jgi:ribosomal protein L19
MLFKLEKELLLKKLIQKVHQKLYINKKINSLNIFDSKIHSGKLVYVILKGKVKKNSEYISGICISKKSQLSQTSIQILNITLGMKIVHTLILTSPLLFICTFLTKKKKKKNLFKLKSYFNKLYYLKQQTIKHLRTKIISKSLV